MTGSRYDLVVRGGTVVDGSGLAPYRADVGVVDRRIAKVGVVRGRATFEVDARDHVVTPGFIDGHTHMDAQLFWDPLGSSSCWHGITTVVMGNCGFSLAPADPERRGLVLQNLERAEDISGAAMELGIPWAWGSFSQFMDAVDRTPKAINYVAQIGHSALRTYVMGPRALEERATASDLELMGDELVRALGAGAVGFTTSRSPIHEMTDGHPVPSRIAGWDEVCHLVNRMAEAGGGIFQSEWGPEVRTDSDRVRSEIFEPLLELALETGVTVTVGIGPMEGRLNPLVGLVDSICAGGGRAFGQSHSRGVSGLYSFEALMPYDQLDEWRSFRSWTLAEQSRGLADPGMRNALISAAQAADRRGEFDVERLHFVADPVGPHERLVDVARDRGTSTHEALMELALETHMKAIFAQPATTFDPGPVLEHLRHPRMVMTFSDSGAHVRRVMDSSIQTHLLAYWVRQRGDLGLEEAVRMLTLAPATAWGLADRGLVREGFAADLNVIDPDRVAPLMPVLVHDLPGGEPRFLQRSTGIRATIVGGEATLVDGCSTGAMPGQLLRGRR